MKKMISIADVNKRIPARSKLTAIEFSDSFRYPNGAVHRRAVFQCECGISKTMNLGTVTSGTNISCGCMRNIGFDNGISRKRDGYYPKIQNIWMGMLDRCYKPMSKSYKFYGGRGVIVCDEWHSYQVFLNWALLNGWEDGLQLDKDVIGDGLLYSPETCCFVTKLVNANNTRSNKYVVYKGITMSLADACRAAKVTYPTMQTRMYRNNTLSFEEALNLYQ